MKFDKRQKVDLTGAEWHEIPIGRPMYQKDASSPVAHLKSPGNAMHDASSILNEAATIVNGARQQTHGDKERCFGMIAKLWSVYLGVDISDVDAAWMMNLLKVARAKSGAVNSVDHSVDAAGYSAIAGELSFARQQHVA